MSDWTRQPALACEFCGEPGHWIVVPPPPSLRVDADLSKPTFIGEHRHITCPEHRFLVIQRAKNQQDPDRFAWREHGRPPLGSVGSLEQERQVIRQLLDRLETAGQDVDDLRRHVDDVFGADTP